MAKKSEEIKTTHLETVVVGSGVAGILAARRMQAAFPSLQMMVLESEDRRGGRLHTGLHLLDSDLTKNSNLECGPTFEKALIRWEKNWLSQEEIPWDSDEWIAEVPQWKRYTSTRLSMLLGLEESEISVAVKTSAPVNKLESLSDGPELGPWKLTTPENIYVANRVIWAAGITAFQNAYGKHESRDFLEGNPLYNQDAADFRGGLSWEFSVPKTTQFEEKLNLTHVIGLPVRFNSKLYLMVGTALFTDTELQFRFLIHLHRDQLCDPKEVSSIHKAMRRTLKNIATDGDNLIFSNEKMVQQTRIGGHALGSAYLFGSGHGNSLNFVGDESLAGVKHSESQELIDTLAASQSVKTLTEITIHEPELIEEEISL